MGEDSKTGRHDPVSRREFLDVASAAVLLSGAATAAAAEKSSARVQKVLLLGHPAWRRRKSTQG